MSVIVTFQLSASFEQYQEMNKKFNPENLMPPGMLTHIVSQHEAGLAITDVWDDGANAKAFYESVAAVGFQVSNVIFSDVYEYIV